MASRGITIGALLAVALLGRMACTRPEPDAVPAFDARRLPAPAAAIGSRVALLSRYARYVSRAPNRPTSLALRGAAAGPSQRDAPFNQSMLPVSSGPAAPPESADATTPDTLPQAVVVELRLGRIGARTVEAYRVDDEALIPLSQFFDLGGIRATVSSTGHVSATLQPGNVPLVIDLDRDEATLGRRSVSVPRRLKLMVKGELFFPATSLGELLDAPMYVNWPELEVVMRDAGPLPVAQELRRRAARAALASERSELATGLWVPAERRRWDGFVVDYSLLSPSSEPIGGSSYALQAGADLLGGSLELGASSLGRADAGDIRIDASWLGVWHDNAVLKQLRLGDGLASGPRPRGMRGASVTNAPFVRPSLLGIIPYAGRLPAGWEVEAYRGGQLIAFDSTDASGDYSVRLPVLYGENPVQFIAYGPYGETRVYGQTYRVSSALLPAGRLEYAASGGECRFYACVATANLDLRYGLSQRWTIEAGADQFWRDSLGDLFHPYAAVTGSLANAVTMEVEGVGRGFIRSGLAFEPSLDTRVTAEYTRFDTDVASPLITLPGRRGLWELSAFYRPIRDKDFFYFEGAAERATTAGLTTDRARIGASMQTGPLRVMPYARIERNASAGASTETRRFWGLNTTVLPRRNWGRLLGQSFFRGAIETQDLSQITLASLAVARPITPQVRLELGVSWVQGFTGPSYTLSLATNLNSMRAFTTATAQRGTPASASQLVQGSVLYDRSRGGLQLGAGPSLQRAGIAGRVFLDANGNGRYDPDEEGLPHVRVQVGSTNALSDSRGAYRLWDIVPFEPVAVAVDSLSFDSPLWIAANPSIELIAAPNRYTIVDIPVVTGSVIEGRVLRGAGGNLEGVGGVGLTLVEQGSGRRNTMTTFTDGSFYLLGVRPGRYTLTVDDRVLELLQMKASRREFVIEPNGDGPGSIDLTLTPR